MMIRWPLLEEDFKNGMGTCFVGLEEVMLEARG